MPVEIPAVELPSELWYQIFRYIATSDILQLSLSCSTFHKLLKSESLWRIYCQRGFNTPRSLGSASPLLLYKNIIKPYRFAIDMDFMWPGMAHEPARVRFRDGQLVIEKRNKVEELLNVQLNKGTGAVVEIEQALVLLNNPNPLVRIGCIRLIAAMVSVPHLRQHFLKINGYHLVVAQLRRYPVTRDVMLAATTLFLPLGEGFTPRFRELAVVPEGGTVVVGLLASTLPEPG
eukprot:sb/3469395/